MSLRHSKTASLTWPFPSWCWPKRLLSRKHTSGSQHTHSVSNTKKKRHIHHHLLFLYLELIIMSFTRLRPPSADWFHRKHESPHSSLCHWNRYQTLTPLPLVFLASREHISFSIWDRWNIYGYEDFTLSDFINAVRVSGSECWLQGHSQQLFWKC